MRHEHFACSRTSARLGARSAVIYSVIGTCRLLDVNPEEYLTWVLPNLATATNMNATGLLPHDFKKLFQKPDC